MGYFLITEEHRQRGRRTVSWYLQNMVCENADKDFYKSASHFAVMRALVSFADNDGDNCFPSQETLAIKSGCSPRTVRRTLREFEDEDWIKSKQTGRSNRYRILAHGAVDPKLAVKLAKERAAQPPNSRGRPAEMADQSGQNDRSDRTNWPIRPAKMATDSCQRLSQQTSHQSLSSSSFTLRGSSTVSGQNGDSRSDDEDESLRVVEEKRLTPEKENKRPLGSVDPPEIVSTVTSESVEQKYAAAAVLFDQLIKQKCGCLEPVRWLEIVRRFGEQYPRVGPAITPAVPLGCADHELILGFEPRNEKQLRALEDYLPGIEQIASSVFGQNRRVHESWRVFLQVCADLEPSDPALLTAYRQATDAAEREEDALEMQERAQELSAVRVTDDNAHECWNLLCNASEEVVDRVAKTHSDPRFKGGAKKH